MPFREPELPQRPLSPAVPVTVRNTGSGTVAAHAGTGNVLSATAGGVIHYHNSGPKELTIADVSEWLASLSSPFDEDVMAEHKALRAQRSPGTCLWALPSDWLTDWKSGSAEHRVLLIHGIFGCGKSVLASYIAHELAPQTDPTKSTARVYLYFKDKADNQQPLFPQIIATILKQLVEHKKEDLSTVTKALLEHHPEPKKKWDSIPSSEHIDLLVGEIRSFRTVYFIVDALEKCGKAQSLLVEAIGRLPLNVKVLVTAQTGKIAADDFVVHQEYHLDTKANPFDMKEYVRWRLSKEKSLRWIIDQGSKEDPNFREAVISRIIDESSGIFLLTKAHVDRLREVGSLAEFMQALGQLPSNTSKAFSAAIERIVDQDQSRQAMASHVFTWLFHGSPPLTVEYIQHSFAVVQLQQLEHLEATSSVVLVHRGEQPHSLRHHLRAKDDFVSACGRLVFVDQNTKEAHFIHPAVEDHVRGVLMISSDPDAQLATQCFAYLSRVKPIDDLSDEAEIQKQLREYPFLKYASSHWILHLGRVKQESIDDVVRQGVEFLRDSKRVANAFQFMQPRGPGQMTGLHAAVFADFGPLTESLIDDGVCDINSKCSRGQTPLHWATLLRRTDSVELLMQRRADPGVQDAEGDTPLSLAVKMIARESADETENTVLLERLLLGDTASGARARMNVADSKRMTPFLWAAKHGPHYAIKLLARHQLPGLNAYTGPDSVPRSPMRDAVEYLERGPREEIVEILLKQGANLNDALPDGWLPLTEAIKLGYEDLVALLLFHGAKTAPDGEESAPLMWAIRSKRIRMVQLLIQYGANVSRKYDTGLTPLIHAIFMGLRLQAWLLLEAGAPLDQADQFGSTALHAAIGINGDRSLAWLLVSKGANPHLRDDQTLSPVDMAIVRGDHDLVWMLLECAGFSDLASSDKEGMTPLHFAAAQGNEKTVALLLAKAADLGDMRAFLDAPNKWGFTALILATQKQHLGVIELLTRQGASCHVRDMAGMTALHHAAAQGGTVEAALLLLNGGAEVDARDADGKTPLILAAEGGAEAVVHALLKRGARPGLLDATGRTAEDAAMDRGHGEVAWLLTTWNIDGEAGQVYQGAGAI